MSYCDQVEVAPSLVLTVDSPVWGGQSRPVTTSVQHPVRIPSLYG